MKILVTGFKPFLGHQMNPSENLAVDLSQAFIEVESLVLPVEFKRGFEVLNSHLEKHRYDYVIMLGQAAGRDKVCLERFALNWVETSNKDEAGVIPPTGKIIEEAPLSILTKFPLDKIITAVKNKTSLVKVSFSAGTYVCNDLYFRMSYAHPEINSIFIHVPLVPEQNVVGNHHAISLDYEDQFKTLKLVISELLSAQ
ncbi:MAG: pyroglutamyl-peptidase I family protein [Pseudobdellovibrio sp.]